MKDIFNEALYRELAAQLSTLSPAFDRKKFLAHALDDLESREVMARMHRTAEAVAAALPVTYRQQLKVLRALAPLINRGFVALFLGDFVATYGLAPADLEVSLEALKFFTRFGSSEFAIRPFIERDPQHVISVMRTWATDPDEHVRRLASEGSRPRLPWGKRLAFLVVDPTPTLPILESLRADPALYVRKSVANHLNDIAKDHPDIVLALVATWDKNHAHTAWIIRHALRTLIKSGHPHALAQIGAGTAAKLTGVEFAAEPRALKLGETLTLTATFTSADGLAPAASLKRPVKSSAKPTAATKTQRLVVDYIVHYARAGDTSSKKVFKWTTLDLAPGETTTLTKRQTIRDFSTRKHHAGVHRVELQINGKVLAETAFKLTLAKP